jgi:hypothetical protein
VRTRAASLISAALLSAVWPMAAAQTPGSATAAKPRDFAKTDVCQLVPGEAVARALGMKLADAQSFVDPGGAFARCTYLVVPIVDAGDLRKGYSVWLQPAGDFERLKASSQGPTSPVPDLGDTAYLFQDPGDGRVKLRALKKGDAVLMVTADTAEAARRIAEVAVTSVWPPK